MRAQLLAFALSLAAGCNAIAGIADFTTVDGAGGAGPDAGGDAPSADAAGEDAGNDAALPACNDPDVPLRISVVESKSGDFSGITDTHGLFASLGVGETFAQCVPKHLTVLDLRAEPGDPSNASHDWGACGVGRRCAMTVEAATILDVHLQ
jgi:hypothetical protein